MRLVRGEAFGARRARVCRAALSPEGTRIALGDNKGHLAIFERRESVLGTVFTETASTGVPPFGPYSRPEVRAIAWSPDGSCLATDEGSVIRLRSARDLSETAVADGANGGERGIAFAGEGRWVAAGGSSLRFFRTPKLDDRRICLLTPKCLCALPWSSRVVVSTEGDTDETAMGQVIRRDPSPVHVVEAATGEVVATLETDDALRQVEPDAFRKRILTVTYGDVGVWSDGGVLLRRFRPYEGAHAQALAIGDEWIVTAPSRASSGESHLDLWHADTFEHLDRVEVEELVGPDWIVAGGDPRTFFTSHLAAYGVNGVRRWSVEGGARRGAGVPSVSRALAAKLGALVDAALLVPGWPAPARGAERALLVRSTAALCCYYLGEAGEVYELDLDAATGALVPVTDPEQIRETYAAAAATYPELAEIAHVDPERRR